MLVNKVTCKTFFCLYDKAAKYRVLSPSSHLILFKTYNLPGLQSVQSQTSAHFWLQGTYRKISDSLVRLVVQILSKGQYLNKVPCIFIMRIPAHY